MKPVKRIAWASPFSAASDISAFTRNLLKHLALADEHADWEVYLLVNDNGPRYRTDLPTFSLKAGGGIEELVALFDFCIVNIGNNQENHLHIFELLAKVPCIVVFHDYVYQHFLAWDCFERYQARELYGYLMCELYDDPAMRVLESSRVCSRQDGHRVFAPWDSALATEFSMASLYARQAAALIVHSEFSERMARGFFHGPILRLQLPSDQKRAPDDGDVADWASASASKRILRAVSFGHISRQKCLHLTLEALASSAVLRERMHYVIAGHPGDKRYVEELRQRTRQWGLEGNVRFELSVSDARLLQIKKDADLFVNIRFPNTEGASGSLVEQMNTGRPVVVANSGCYADMPEGTVVKIGNPSDAGELAAALERLTEDAAGRVAVGLAGRDHIRRIDGARYASELKSFLHGNEALLKRRRRHVQRVTSEARVSCDPADREWLADLSDTRAALAMFEFDRHVFSPRPFLEWPPQRAAHFACAVLLDEYANTGLMEEMRGQIVADPLAFHARLSRLRALYRFAVRDEPGEDMELIRLSRIQDLDFWRLAVHMRPSVFVRLAFLAVLNRPWRNGEAVLYEKQMEMSGSAKDVLMEFMGLPEARRAQGGGAELEALLRWAGQEDPEVVCAGMPLCTLGRDLLFDDKYPENQVFLKGLWYKPEPAGTWSYGERGALVMPMPLAAEGDLRLSVVLRTVGADRTGGVDVQIWLGDQSVATCHLADDRLTTCSAVLPRARWHGFKCLKFEIRPDQEIVPKALGLSDDGRTLGVLLKMARLERLDAPISRA